MYELEAFLSLVVVLAYVEGDPARADGSGPSCSCCRWLRCSTCTTGRSSSASGLRSRRCSLRASGCVFGVAAAASPCSTCHGCRRCSRRCVTRCAVVDGAELPRSRASRRPVFDGDAPLVAFVLGRRRAGCRAHAATRRTSARSSSRSWRRSRSRLPRVALVADLARVDGALLRRRARAVAVVGARGLARARRLGFAALACLFLWAGYSLKDDKENARADHCGDRAFMQPGELVISTHPEQVPVFATTSGRVPLRDDVGPVADSADLRLARRDRPVQGRERRADARPAARRRCRLGHEFVVVTPVFRDYRAWNAHVDEARVARSRPRGRAAPADPRFGSIAHIATDEIALGTNYFKPMQAFVYRRLR